MECAYYRPLLKGIAVKRNTVQFSLNRDAEQCWVVSHFAQLFMQVAQHCVAERFGSEINPSLNGIAVKRSHTHTQHFSSISRLARG